MTIALSNITGGTVPGFTTPVFTVASDNPPDAATGKQWNIPSLASGTATGVRYHAISDPFTITFERPRALKTLLGLVSAVTGVYGQVPENVYIGCRVRKGVLIAANNVPRVARFDGKWVIPAGSDAYDQPNIKALVSAAIGALNQVSSGLCDTLLNGAL